MDLSEWSHVLRLMGLVVVADKRVYQEEVATFVAKTLELHQSLSPEMLFTQKMAFDWFVAHREELSELIDNPDYKKQVTHHVLSLGEYDNLEPLLQAMWAVSASDGEHHDSEVGIVNLAATFWKLPVPKA